MQPDSVPEDATARTFDLRARAMQEASERPPKEVMQEKLARLAAALGVAKKKARNTKEKK